MTSAGGFGQMMQEDRVHPPETTHWFRRQPLEDVVIVPWRVDCRDGMLFVDTRRVYDIALDSSGAR